MEPYQLDILNRFNARRGQKELLTSDYDLRLVSNKRSGRSTVKPFRFHVVFFCAVFLCVNLEFKKADIQVGFIQPTKM